MTTATTPTPLELVAEIHQRTPDGTRRLRVTAPTRELRPAQSKLPRDCWVALVYAHTGAEPPASCQRVIDPGLFYVLYEPVHPSTSVRGQRYRYCAPCAVREWPRRDVREANE